MTKRNLVPHAVWLLFFRESYVDCVTGTEMRSTYRKQPSVSHLLEKVPHCTDNMFITVDCHQTDPQQQVTITTIAIGSIFVKQLISHHQMMSVMSRGNIYLGEWCSHQEWQSLVKNCLLAQFVLASVRTMMLCPCFESCVQVWYFSYFRSVSLSWVSMKVCLVRQTSS